MRPPSDNELVRWQQQLEQSLTRFSETEIRRAIGRVSQPDVHTAAVAYVTRPSKRLLGMAFLHAAHSLGVDFPHDDLIAVATALEIRHGAILLHDDIVDQDTQRGGHPTAPTALIDTFGPEAGGAALFAGDILAGMAGLPVLRSTLPASLKVRLIDLFQETTALVAAGQTEQLHLDARRDVMTVREGEILSIHSGHFAPYLMCSLVCAAALSGLPDGALHRIVEAGVPLAQGFQVQNDVAGFTELVRVLATDGKAGSTLTLANTSDLARRRRTVLIRAALDRLPAHGRTVLADYMAGSDADLTAVADLIATSGAVEHCKTLIGELHATARERIAADPELPSSARTALSGTWGYMTALYDTDSPTSRLYLQARTDLVPAA